MTRNNQSTHQFKLVRRFQLFQGYVKDAKIRLGIRRWRAGSWQTCCKHRWTLGVMNLLVPLPPDPILFASPKLYLKWRPRERILKIGRQLQKYEKQKIWLSAFLRHSVVTAVHTSWLTCYKSHAVEKQLTSTRHSFNRKATFTRYNLLSIRLYNRFDNRLYRVNGVLVFSTVFSSAFYRWRHSFFIRCQYGCTFLLHCGLG